MPVNSTVDEGSTSTGDETTLPVNELFHSIQGEGKLNGISSVFVRTSGCNLRCWFCDSYHTSWEPKHAKMTLDQIVEEIRSFENANHVVLTGGEPLIHKETVALLNRLDNLDYHTTVETNGTVYRDAAIDLVSVSPKLSSSNPTEAKDPKGGGEWETRHDDRRIDLAALVRLVDDYEFQLKFVVTGREDMAEIEELITNVREAASQTVHRSDVLLMPEGTTREELDQRRNEVAEVAMEYGYRYTPRLHVDLWNDAVGR